MLFLPSLQSRPHLRATRRTDPRDELLQGGLRCESQLHRSAQGLPPSAIALELTIETVARLWLARSSKAQRDTHRIAVRLNCINHLLRVTATHRSDHRHAC